MKGFIDLSLWFKNREFRLLYTGQFTSFLGSSMTMVALPYQVYELTHSTFMVGLLSLAALLPLLVTALIGGVFADRYHRRKLLIVSESLMAFATLGLVLNATLATPFLWLIFLLTMIMSGVNGFHRPAFDGITQQLVDKDDYKAAGVLASFKFNVGMIAGPAIAGLLISHFGLKCTYLIDFFSFALSITCLLLLKRLPSPEEQVHPSLVESLKEGLRFARGNQVLFGSYLVDFAAMVTAMPTALFPAIAFSLGGAKSLGFLYAAPALGALVVTIFSGWTQYISSDGKAIAITSAVFGLAMIGMGLSTHIALALLFLAVAGGADAVSGIFRMNLWNHVIPQAMRGRLSGIEMISYISGPKLGDFRAGVFSSMMGFPGALISGGAFCVISVLFLTIKLPEFWRYDEKNATIPPEVNGSN